MTEEGMSMEEGRECSIGKQEGVRVGVGDEVWMAQSLAQQHIRVPNCELRGRVPSSALFHPPFDAAARAKRPVPRAFVAEATATPRSRSSGSTSMASPSRSGRRHPAREFRRGGGRSTKATVDARGDEVVTLVPELIEVWGWHSQPTRGR
jgi:hypothetical protein